MTERLLQFIWQFQYFNHAHLEGIEGESIQVLAPGGFNTHQGPDFTDGKVRIDHTTWAGNIELHLRTSDWLRHGHEQDPRYTNVILHVVWLHDRVINDVPVLELNSRVAKWLLERYERLMQSGKFIPCEDSIHGFDELRWQSWKERLIIERLQRKTLGILSFLEETNQHWEEVFWWMLARNFGVKVNAEAFEALARSIDTKILARHKNQVVQIEALLLGQGGLLEYTFMETYTIQLQREYRHLRNKYSLEPIRQPLLFLRMRPGNFPSVRLAQLAMLIHQSSHLFSRLREATTLDEIAQWLNVTASEYWNDHYMLEGQSSFKPKRVGSAMVNNVLVNSILPMLFAFGHHHSDAALKERALQWMGSLPAESNAITRGFDQVGKSVESALDSQALMELKNEYCNHCRCLDCAIGVFLLRPGS